MAAINLQSIYLKDKWPGVPNFNLSKPNNGFDTTVTGTGNAVTTALYPLGTKIVRHYTSADQTWAGQSIFCYMQYYEGTDLAYTCLSGDFSDGYNICFHADLTTTGDGSSCGPYMVTNDLTNSDGTKGGAVAIACTDLSSGEYGWFWVGGVCPVADVTDFNSDVTTAGGVVSNRAIAVVDNGANGGAFQLCDHTLLCGTLTADINNLIRGAEVGMATASDV